MEFVKRVVEEELKKAEGHLKHLQFEKEMAESELMRITNGIEQTEKHIAEMKEYLEPKPIAQQLVAQITVNADEVCKEIAKRLHGQHKRPGCL